MLFHLLVIFGIGVSLNSATIGHVGLFGSRTITTFHGMYSYVPSNSYMLVSDVFLCQCSFWSKLLLIHVESQLCVCNTFSISRYLQLLLRWHLSRRWLNAMSTCWLPPFMDCVVVVWIWWCPGRTCWWHVYVTFQSLPSTWVLIAGTQHRWFGWRVLWHLLLASSDFVVSNN